MHLSFISIIITVILVTICHLIVIICIWFLNVCNILTCYMSLLYEKEQSAERETLSNDHHELSVSKHDIFPVSSTL